MRTTRALTGLALGVTLSLGTAACSDDSGSDAGPEPSATEHNEADVAFATDMMQHHAQALVMADLTMDRPLDPRVERLVEDIRAAQGPEIEQFADWLTDWDEEIPETVRDHANAGHGDDMNMDGMDHGKMPGMMSADEMSALEDASDDDFEDLWLEMMIEHHEGAVEMAESEMEQGRFQPALDLAADIADSQSAEIETMQELVG